MGLRATAIQIPTRDTCETTMKLAKYANFGKRIRWRAVRNTLREGLCAESTAAAVVSEIGAGCDECGLVERMRNRFSDSGGLSNGKSWHLRRICATAVCSRNDRVSVSATGSGALGAPLYIAWQVTNECNLACLHCIEESGPGKAFHDELDEAQVFSFLGQVLDQQVPYLSFSGGEPTLHPQFFEMVEYVCGRNAQLKIETNGHGLSLEKARRLKRLGVKACR